MIFKYCLTMQNKNHMTEKNIRIYIVRWLVFSFLPLTACLVVLLGSFNEGIKSYNSCFEKSHAFLPAEIIGTCCVIRDRFESKIIGNKDRLLIPYSDVIRIMWSRMHSLSAVLICLFLTPNFLYFFSLWMHNVRRMLVRLADFTSISVYIFILISFIYAVSTFKDS